MINVVRWSCEVRFGVCWGGFFGLGGGGGKGVTFEAGVHWKL